MSQVGGWRAVAEVATIAGRRVRALARLGPPTAGAAVVLYDQDARVLLVRASYKRHWSIPGGFLNPRESALDGAQRELSEELGLVVGSLESVGSVDGPTRHTTHIFVGSARPDQVTEHSWEIREHAWFAPTTLPRVGPRAAALLRRCEPDPPR